MKVYYIEQTPVLSSWRVRINRVPIYTTNKICFQQVTLKSGRVAKYEYIKENEPEESVHEVTREENFIDVDTATNKESELPDLDHLVSIHLLFSPSSQLKTVGRNCETKVVDFSCRMYILYQDIKIATE